MIGMFFIKALRYFILFAAKKFHTFRPCFSRTVFDCPQQFTADSLSLRVRADCNLVQMDTSVLFLKKLRISGQAVSIKYKPYFCFSLSKIPDQLIILCSTPPFFGQTAFIFTE